jgi:uncharacterized protein
MAEALGRASAFSYRCLACSRCCQGKTIQINPYELARIALALDAAIPDLIAIYTRDGVFLRQHPDGRCVFLGPKGCGIHAHRPLVCRLYPLGRIVNPQGERFVTVPPHPQTEGRYGTEGTVADYLAQQQAEPFIAAADAYYRLYLRLAGAATSRASFEPMDLLDLNGAVRAECAKRRQTLPPTLEERVQCHVDLLFESLA